MASAASIRSGRNISPQENCSPVNWMPGIRAWLMVSSGSRPAGQGLAGQLGGLFGVAGDDGLAERVEEGHGRAPFRIYFELVWAAKPPKLTRRLVKQGKL